MTPPPDPAPAVEPVAWMDELAGALLSDLNGRASFDLGMVDDDTMCDWQAEWSEIVAKHTATHLTTGRFSGSRASMCAGAKHMTTRLSIEQIDEAITECVACRASPDGIGMDADFTEQALKQLKEAMEALREWKCEGCYGSGKNPTQTHIPCRDCRGTGLHPKAREALGE